MVATKGGARVVHGSLPGELMAWNAIRTHTEPPSSRTLATEPIGRRRPTPLDQRRWRFSSPRIANQPGCSPNMQPALGLSPSPNRQPTRLGHRRCSLYTRLGLCLHVIHQIRAASQTVHQIRAYIFLYTRLGHTFFLYTRLGPWLPYIFFVHQIRAKMGHVHQIRD